jgi:hypothetical protein
MSPEEYQQAMADRGFRYCEKQNLWVGPFNVQVKGDYTWDLRRFVRTARVEQIAMLDEKLRAKRGLPRPPSSGGPGAGLY